jgi:hypothetical protein
MGLIKNSGIVLFFDQAGKGNTGDWSRIPVSSDIQNAGLPFPDKADAHTGGRRSESAARSGGGLRKKI